MQRAELAERSSRVGCAGWRRRGQRRFDGVLAADTHFNRCYFTREPMKAKAEALILSVAGD
jgi:hypothetical protein